MQGGLVAALVDATGRALETIMARIGETGLAMAAIASGASAQAERLRGINGAIGEMDRETCANAAMFEETIAAAHALKSETERLAALVGGFTVVEAPRAALQLVA